MKPSEILRRGLELLETRGWTQGVYARDATGQCVDTLEEATCACGIGALRLAEFKTVNVIGLRAKDVFRNYETAITYLDTTINGFIYWQDKRTRTFPEVKDKFLEAIALAEKDEAA